MANQNNKNEAITARDVDFAQWYTDVCKKAELMDYSSVKGFIYYLPYGFAIWEEIRDYLNRRFKEVGVQNVYLPPIIPSSLFNKEKEHIEGFAPETLVATIGGGEDLADPLIIRPTSEVLFCDLFKKRISSYRDLPMIYNQWCSVVRWEKTTRPFLRGAEFLWQEGHCLFETEEAAEKNAADILEIYNRLGEEVLAIPFIKGRKTEHEKFAGAVNTYTIEALMHDGKVLQSGTTYLGRANKLETPHQTSWGVSTRLLGAVIMVHGDDNGLVLPPAVAPIQVVIVPIRQDAPGIKEKCQEIKEKLAGMGIRVHLDDSDHTPGWKFAQWEMKGVPIRLELGPRDLEQNMVVMTKRVNGEKVTASIEEIEEAIPNVLKAVHKDMYEKAKAHLDSKISEAHSIEELNAKLENGGFVKMAFCGEMECEDTIKELTKGATARCICKEEVKDGEVCPACGKPAKIVAYFAKAY